MEIANNLKGLFSSPEKSVATVNRFGPPLVSVLLVAAIAWLLASLTLTLLPRPAVEAAPVPAQRVSAATPDTAAINVNDIVQRHLFGVAPVKAVAGPNDVDPDEELKATNLPMTLVGTLASRNADRSLAIIEAGNDAKVYSVGDTIQAQVTLDEVRAKEVVITNRGKRQLLPLPREQEARSGSRSNSRTASRTRSTPSRRASPARPKATVSQTASAKTLGDLIRPQPVFANGKQRGYRVYPGRQRDQFTALGLKAGDLVTEINGTPLDDPSRGKDVFASLASASQISVTIERNGSPTSLVLDTSQLNFSGDQ
ncbi:MAG: type II secretion system protein GspC [Gammaproteobacteria bacterium]